MFIKGSANRAAQPECALRSRKINRRSKMAQLIWIVVVCFTIVPSYTAAFARTINVLLIHGRMHNPHERYGYFRTDQGGAWGLRPTTAGTVWYVQWDAWNHHFDDSSWSGDAGRVIDSMHLYPRLYPRLHPLRHVPLRFGHDHSVVFGN